MRWRRTLTSEEQRLWSEVVAAARPLRGKPAPKTETAAPAASAPGSPTPPAAAVKARQPAAAQPTVPPAGVRKSPAPLALHPIERPVRRRIGRGRVPLEDRIDLHGLTEAVAHGALLGFLRRAQGEGARHVLVITGRGASFGSQGVLKRALPHWFSTGEFRLLVAGFEPAERSHGGEGAFYVRVRRR